MASSSAQQREIGIFTDSQGSPLQIFVEASIINGSKLRRLLKVKEIFATLLYLTNLQWLPYVKGNGAHIVHQVADAQIIIVDRNSPESVTFADEYTQKVVLDFRWVHRSIQDEQYPNASEQWGGHRVDSGALDITVK